MKTASEIQTGLNQFYGTEKYHRLTILPSLVATDGVAWLCKNAECFWLMDVVASYQKRAMKDPMLQDMQFWTMTVKDGMGKVICERDEGDVFVTQKMETNFPLDEIKIWVERGEAGGNPVMVAMLPNER